MVNFKKISGFALSFICSFGLAYNTKANPFQMLDASQQIAEVVSVVVVSAAEDANVAASTIRTIASNEVVPGKSATKDCFFFKQGEHVVKLPLSLENSYGQLTADSNVEVTSCGGQYQIPLDFSFALEVAKWFEENNEKSKVFEISAYGLSFDIEINKTKSDENAPQIYSIVRLKNKAELEKVLNSKLNFSEGYISPSKNNKPAYLGNICPLPLLSEIQGRLWIVLPANHSADVCKEYK